MQDKELIGTSVCCIEW